MSSWACLQLNFQVEQIAPFWLHVAVIVGHTTGLAATEQIFLVHNGNTIDYCCHGSYRYGDKVDTFMKYRRGRAGRPSHTQNAHEQRERALPILIITRGSKKTKAWSKATPLSPPLVPYDGRHTLAPASHKCVKLYGNWSTTSTETHPRFMLQLLIRCNVVHPRMYSQKDGLCGGGATTGIP